MTDFTRLQGFEDIRVTFVCGDLKTEVKMPAPHQDEFYENVVWWTDQRVAPYRVMIRVDRRMRSDELKRIQGGQK